PDRDDADQLALGHHRHVTEPAPGHDLHEIVHRVVGSAGLHDLGHDRADDVVDDGAVVVEVAYDVALAHDAVDGLSGGADDQGADVVLGQAGDEFSHTGVRGDGDHANFGLGPEHCGDLHRDLPERLDFDGSDLTGT